MQSKRKFLTKQIDDMQERAKAICEAYETEKLKDFAQLEAVVADKLIEVGYNKEVHNIELNDGVIYVEDKEDDDDKFMRFMKKMLSE